MFHKKQSKLLQNEAKLNQEGCPNLVYYCKVIFFVYFQMSCDAFGVKLEG